MSKSISACVIFIFLASCVQLASGFQPFPQQYKIKPNEPSKMTAADILGPDGIVYPDWRYAGVPGGIPVVDGSVKIENFGGIADDDLDDSRALQSAVNEVGRKGGGVVVLAKGKYLISTPVIVTHDNVVVRGQGKDKTRITFKYLPNEICFFRPRNGDTIGPDDWIEIHANPKGQLKDLYFESKGKRIYSIPPSRRANDNFVIRTSGQSTVEKLGKGNHKLKAVVEWKDGTTSETSIEVTVDPNRRLEPGQWRYPTHPKASVAALMFVGDKQSGKTWNLAKDGKRGDVTVELNESPDLVAGDAILLMARHTDRWRKVIRSASDVQDCRRYQFQVKKVEGSRVTLNQPLRIDYPIADESFVQQIFPIRKCGVEGLSITQTEKLWTTGILFLNAWECWAQHVNVTKAGRYPIYSRYAKWCEIRDCEFNDAWYKGGGGTAYVGWERSYDCLMENVKTKGLRHAPCVQWAAAGNVVRNSTFIGSDAQWHAGWSNENLFENCVVHAYRGTGSYGHGAYSTSPRDRNHGPNGPRNVVYNCDFVAPRSGIWMGGMNENWLILHNRIRAKKGPGIFAQHSSFDHIIRNNVIALESKSEAGLVLKSNDCIGIEFENNVIYGDQARLTSGVGSPLLEKGNVVHAFANEIPRPKVETPSIFEWQREHVLFQDGDQELDSLGTATPNKGPLETTIKNAVLVDKSAFEWNWGAWDQEKIVTFGDYQYTIYWTAEKFLAVGRRNLLTNEAQHVHLPQYKLKANDRHRNTCLGVSADDGRLHLSWDHHNDPLRYTKSRKGFLTSPPETMTAEDFETAAPMLQNPKLETPVTYPRFFTDRDGVLFFFYRIGSSGKGDNYLHRYDPESTSWTRVGMVTSRKGTYGPWNKSTTRNAYFQDLHFDKDNRLHAIWVYRETSRTWASNHDLHYAFSDDQGVIWKNNAGEQIADLAAGDPIELTDPGLVVVDIPIHSWLMNAGPMNFDSQNRPHIVTFKASEIQDSSHTKHDPTNAIRSKLVFVHYWRDKQGKFRGGKSILPGKNGIYRGDLVFDKNDNLLFFYPTSAGIEYYWAKADENWADFDGPYQLTNDRFTAPQRNSTKHDRVRWKMEGILSITVSPQEGGFSILDFELREK